MLHIQETTEVPCEADASRQEEFVRELAETFSQMDPATVIYYADGVHPTHNSRSTYAWIEKGERPEQPTFSGRDRVNINGLLNAHDVTDVIVLDCESVNAESTKQLYQMALDRHPDAPAIYIISDNARYYSQTELICENSYHIMNDIQIVMRDKICDISLFDYITTKSSANGHRGQE